jgi:hypothetical protein
MDSRMQDREYIVDFFAKRTPEIVDNIAAERPLVYQVSED